MERFEILGRNGSGANSTVYRCRDTTSEIVVAVKKLEGASLLQILQEAAIMRICAHEHCVKLLEAHQATNSGTGCLVLENVEHSLSRELLLSPRGLPLSRAKLIAYQLAQALELVHKQQISHGDIKPANILLTSQCGVKLCDFGSATLHMDPCHSAGASSAVSTAVSTALGLLPTAANLGGGHAVTTAAASRWYCAPESLLGMSGSSPAADIWAMGCVLGELVTGRPLMPGSDQDMQQLCWVVSMVGHLSQEQERVVARLPCHQQRAKIEEARARGPLLDRIPKIAASPELLQVLRACLHSDPAQRPTAQQLQAFPLFDDLRPALQTCEQTGSAASPPAAPAPVHTLAQDKLRTAAAATTTASVETAETRSPQLKRRTSSVNMDLDKVETPGPAASLDVRMAPCPADTSPLGGAAAAAETPQLPAAAAATRRMGGVQAAAPVQPVLRTRVSALTATLRGSRPFEADGGYVDLMPQVLQLEARLRVLSAEAGARRALGPIALGSRRVSSLSQCSDGGDGELLAPSADVCRASSGGGGAQTAPEVCATPVAAAAGARGWRFGPSAFTESSQTPAASTAASPMDRSRSVPPAAAAAATPGASTPASFGACFHLALSSCGFATPTTTTPTSAAAKPSPAHMRSRAIVNRARRRHHSREPRAGSVPASFIPGSCPSSCPRIGRGTGGGGGGGLGGSATLLQKELEYAAAPEAAAMAPRALGVDPPATAAARPPCHTGWGRSFADLSELVSIGERAPILYGTPSDVKRRRGLASGPCYGSQPLPASGLGRLQAEVVHGSLPKGEAM